MGILEPAQVLLCEGAGLQAGRGLQGQTSAPWSVLPAASGAMGAELVLIRGRLCPTDQTEAPCSAPSQVP